MKKIIVVLMLLNLISAANAASTHVKGRSKFKLFRSECLCTVDTEDDDVWATCTTGMEEKGLKPAPKNTTCVSVGPERLVKVADDTLSLASSAAILYTCASLGRLIAKTSLKLLGKVIRPMRRLYNNYFVIDQA
jgi:hypothetical protein